MFGSDSQNLFHNVQNNKYDSSHQITYINDIESDNTYAGVIPRAIFSLFHLMSQQPFKERKFALYCSFLQIYNEKIFDLLLVIFIIFLLYCNDNRKAKNLYKYMKIKLMVYMLVSKEINYKYMYSILRRIS